MLDAPHAGPLGEEPLDAGDLRARLLLRVCDLFGSEVRRVAILVEFVDSEPLARGVLPAAASKVPNAKLSYDWWVDFNL